MTAYGITTSFYDRGRGIASIDAILVAAAVAMEIPNNGNIITIIKNGAMASITATLKAVPDPYGRGGGAGAVGDEVLTITAGSYGFIPFAHVAMFNNGATAQITLSSATTITVAFIELLKAR